MRALLLAILLLLPLSAGAQNATSSALGQSAPGGAAPSASPAPAAKPPPVVQAKPNPKTQPHKPPAKTAAKPKPGTQAKPATPAAPAPAPAPAEPPAPAPAPAEPAKPAEDPNIGSVTKLPIPRFMSLGFNEVNLRVGPGLRYPIDWVYHRRDLPVEVLRELDEWRLIRDQDNVKGWVRASTLSSRRGFVVKDTEQVLRSRASDDSSAVALLKPGVVGRIRSCAADSDWCEVDAAAYRGWLKRAAIYGAYPNEVVGG